MLRFFVFIIVVLFGIAVVRGARFAPPTLGLAIHCFCSAVRACGSCSIGVSSRRWSRRITRSIALCALVLAAPGCAPPLPDALCLGRSVRVPPDNHLAVRGAPPPDFTPLPQVRHPQSSDHADQCSRDAKVEHQRATLQLQQRLVGVQQNLAQHELVWTRSGKKSTSAIQAREHTKTIGLRISKLGNELFCAVVSTLTFFRRQFAMLDFALSDAGWNRTDWQEQTNNNHTRRLAVSHRQSILFTHSAREGARTATSGHGWLLFCNCMCALPVLHT